MNEKILYLLLLLSIIVSSMAIPAYAEVTSLKTNAPFYKGGSKINFSGTIQDTDPPNVTILIFNPNNQFIMLTSGLADSNHQFQVVLDTSTPDSPQKLSVKGIYNATAFIAKQENGKTASFVFSPDGSPIAPSSPTSLTASSRSSTEIDLSWSSPANNGGSPISGYLIERNDGTGFTPLVANTGSTITTYQNTGLIPNKQYSYRASAINSAGTSGPSNVVTIATIYSSIQTTTPPTQTPNPNNQNSTSSLDELLKKRMEDAKRLKELLHGQTPSSTTPSNKQHSVNPVEKMQMADSVNTLQNQKSTSMPENNLIANGFANFDVKNIIYPAISLVGVGIVLVIVYFRKKQKLASNPKINTYTQQTVEPTPVESDDDYAMMIIKNRLAKGEISVEDFKMLKDELSEP